MSDTALAYLLVPLGIFFVIAGVLTRLGRLRRGVTFWDQHPDLPAYWRNTPYGLIPSGIGLILMSLGLLVPSWDPQLDGVDVLLGLVGLLCLFVALAIQVDPPDDLKPEWRRREEREREERAA